MGGFFSIILGSLGRLWLFAVAIPLGSLWARLWVLLMFAVAIKVVLGFYLPGSSGCGCSWCLQLLFLLGVFGRGCN